MSEGSSGGDSNNNTIVNDKVLRYDHSPLSHPQTAGGLSLADSSSSHYMADIDLSDHSTPAAIPSTYSHTKSHRDHDKGVNSSGRSNHDIAAAISLAINTECPSYFGSSSVMFSPNPHTRPQSISSQLVDTHQPGASAPVLPKRKGPAGGTTMGGDAYKMRQLVSHQTTSHVSLTQRINNTSISYQDEEVSGLGIDMTVTCTPPHTHTAGQTVEGSTGHSAGLHGGGGHSAGLVSASSFTWSVPVPKMNIVIMVVGTR